jgi:hypothetical protein
MENKTKLNISQAADLSGFSRTHIHKLIKKGDLTAEGPAGRKVIDLSELARLYPHVLTGEPKPNSKVTRNETSQVTSILQSQIERLERELDAMRQERDSEKRAREREQEEARLEREKLHSIIERQTYMLAPPKDTEPKKTFWQRWFG